MMLDIKAKDDEGNILFEGKLNKKEVGFLIQYAVNDLVAAGVHFNLQAQSTDEKGDEQMRFDYETVGGVN